MNPAYYFMQSTHDYIFKPSTQAILKIDDQKYSTWPANCMFCIRDTSYFMSLYQDDG